MSLIAAAIRISAVRALAGRTLAENRVSDSQIVPVDQLTQTDRQMFAIVSIDEDTGEAQGKDVTTLDHRLILNIEMGVAGATTMENGDVQFTVPYTDDGMELALDVMQRQVTRALWDEGTVWSRLFMRFMATLVHVGARRGVDASAGQRFAARQLLLHMDVLGEPEFGRPPVGPFADLLTALRAADSAGITQANALEAAAVGDELLEWRAGMLALGYTLEDALGIRATPFIMVKPLADEDSVVMTDVAVQGQDLVTSDPNGEAYDMTTVDADKQLPGDGGG